MMRTRLAGLTVGVTIRVTSRRKRGLSIASSGESHMKRFVILTVLFTFIAGAFAAMAPASADPHGDRFKAECKSGARKC
jgi:hypothetical protein